MQATQSEGSYETGEHMNARDAYIDANSHPAQAAFKSYETNRTLTMALQNMSIEIESWFGDEEQIAVTPASLADFQSRMETLIKALEVTFQSKESSNLQDMFDLGIEAMYVLACSVETLRRLLLASGRAYNNLGAATLGDYDFANPDDAVSLWKIAEGTSARHLTEFLSSLGSCTPSAHIEKYKASAPETGETSWIETCSRVGQDVLRWAYSNKEAVSKFAPVVGSVWPGPAVYGYGNGSEAPQEACKLSLELVGGYGANKPLFGIDYVVVEDDHSLVIPERLLENSNVLYANVHSEDGQMAIVCQGEVRHFYNLAKNIREEYELEACAWGPSEVAINFDEWFMVLAGSKQIPVKEGRISIQEFEQSTNIHPGSEVCILGNGDYLEMFATEPYEDWDEDIDFDEMWFSELEEE